MTKPGLVIVCAFHIDRNTLGKVEFVHSLLQTHQSERIMSH